MEERISEIFSELEGQYVDFEIVYVPDRRFPKQIEHLLGDGWESPQLRDDINYLDLSASRYELMDEEEYNSIIEPEGAPFSDFYEDPEKARILVIYLTKESYRILTDPDSVNI